MPHIKTFDTTIDVANPINFCADKMKHAMTRLKNTFEGKCYKGAFIVKIAEITKISDCTISRSDTTGAGAVDVVFTAEVVVAAKGDIVVGIEIKHVEGLIVGDVTRAGEARYAVSLLPRPESKILRPGNLACARLDHVRHNPFAIYIAAVGVPLTCDREFSAYKIVGDLTPTAAARLRVLLEDVDAEMALRAKTMEAHRDGFIFFEALLLAHKRPTLDEFKHKVESATGGAAYAGPAVADSKQYTHVVDVVRAAVEGKTVPMSGTWSRPLALPRSSPLALKADSRDDSAATQNTIEEFTPEMVAFILLKSIRDNLRATRNMVEVYNTPELLESHKHVWLMMGQAQQPHADYHDNLRAAESSRATPKAAAATPKAAAATPKAAVATPKAAVAESSRAPPKTNP